MAKAKMLTADEIEHARTVLKPKPKKGKGENRTSGEAPPVS